MKKYINSILGVVTSAVLLFIIYHQKNDIKESNRKYEIIQLRYDSLKSEMFTKDIQIGRFEIILDRAQGEMSPDCKEEFEKILHETE